jgi:CRISP-associated protein Cas1
MNPFYVDTSACGIKLQDHCLVILDKKHDKELARFKPRQIPHDSIVIQKAGGFISLGALNWLMAHSVNVAILDWRGNLLGQFLFGDPVSNELKVSQYEKFLDRREHLSIARTIVQTKLWRQNEFLKSLSGSYPVSTLTLPRVNVNSEDFMRNQEARFATEYFTELGKAFSEIGYEFRGRSLTKTNQHAPDMPNALLNYAYSFLKIYVRRSLNAVGLDSTLPFLHDLRKNSGLVYDLMELWRTNCDYSVLQTLEIMKRQKKKQHAISFIVKDGYEVRLEPETVNTLLERLRFNISHQEIIFNTRILARYLTGKRKDLNFDLRVIEVPRKFETDRVKIKILSKTARELKMNKSTLWHQKKRLVENGSLRLYNITKHHFVE